MQHKLTSHNESSLSITPGLLGNTERDPTHFLRISSPLKKTRPLVPPLDSDSLSEFKREKWLAAADCHSTEVCRCHLTSTQTCFVTYHPNKKQIRAPGATVSRRLSLERWFIIHAFLSAVKKGEHLRKVVKNEPNRKCAAQRFCDITSRWRQKSTTVTLGFHGRSKMSELIVKTTRKTPNNVIPTIYALPSGVYWENKCLQVN